MTIAITCTLPARGTAPRISIPRGATETVTVSVYNSNGTPHDGTGSVIRLAMSARNSTSEVDIAETAGSSTGVYTFTVPAALSRRLTTPWAYQAWLIEASGNEIPLSEVGVLAGLPTVTPHGHSVTDDTLAVHRVYYGVGVAGITNPVTIEAMSHQDNTSQSFLATVSPSNQKIYLAHPASWGTPVITVGGFAFDQLATSSIILHDADGNVIVYTLHESTNLLTMTSAQVEVQFL